MGVREVSCAIDWREVGEDHAKGERTLNVRAVIGSLVKWARRLLGTGGRKAGVKKVCGRVESRSQAVGGRGRGESRLGPGCFGISNLRSVMSAGSPPMREQAAGGKTAVCAVVQVSTPTARMGRTMVSRKSRRARSTAAGADAVRCRARSSVSSAL